MIINGKEYNISSKLIITVLIGIILLLAKCNSDKISEIQAQFITSQNNISVLQDSIITYTTKNGSLISERGILIAEKEELKTLNAGLYEVVNNLEKSIPNMKPIVVVEYITSIETDTVYLKSDLVAINDSTYNVKFGKDTIYDENNSRQITGEVTINLKSDSTEFNQVQVGNVSLTKDKVNITASLVIGERDGDLKVWLETKYPGFSTDEIEAVTLDPDIHPELKKLKNTKKFSVGPYIGFGLGENFSISPSVGIGVQYSIFKF